MKKFKMLIVSLLFFSPFFMASCQDNSDNNTTENETEVVEETTADEEAEDSAEKNTSEEVESLVYKNTYNKEDFEVASEDEVLNIINDEDTESRLIDARPQESFAGWALEGAENGVHYKAWDYSQAFLFIHKSSALRI